MSVPFEKPSQAVSSLEVPLVRRTGEGGAELILADSGFRTRVMQTLAQLPENTTKSIKAGEKEWELVMNGAQPISVTQLRVRRTIDEIVVLGVRRTIDEIVVLGATKGDAPVPLESFLNAKVEETDRAMNALSQTPAFGIPSVRKPLVVTEAIKPSAVEVALTAKIAEQASRGNKGALKLAMTIINGKRASKDEERLEGMVPLGELDGHYNLGLAVKAMLDGIKIIPGTKEEEEFHLAVRAILDSLAKDKNEGGKWAAEILRLHPPLKPATNAVQVQTESGKAAPTLAQALRLLRCEADPEGKNPTTNGNKVDRGLRALDHIVAMKGNAKAIAFLPEEMAALTSIIGIMGAALTTGVDQKKKEGGAALISARSGDRGKRTHLEGVMAKLTELETRATWLKQQQTN